MYIIRQIIPNHWSSIRKPVTKMLVIQSIGPIVKGKVVGKQCILVSKDSY